MTVSIRHWCDYNPRLGGSENCGQGRKHLASEIPRVFLLCGRGTRHEDIDFQLNFDQHISNPCRKAGQRLNVVKRLDIFLSRLNKLTILRTFISSNFDDCPLAWHFCSESNSKMLEKIQERALRCL